MADVECIADSAAFPEAEFERRNNGDLVHLLRRPHLADSGEPVEKIDDDWVEVSGSSPHPLPDATPFPDEFPFPR